MKIDTKDWREESLEQVAAHIGYRPWREMCALKNELAQAHKDAESHRVRADGWRDRALEANQREGGAAKLLRCAAYTAEPVGIVEAAEVAVKEIRRLRGELKAAEQAKAQPEHVDLETAMRNGRIRTAPEPAAKDREPIDDGDANRTCRPARAMRCRCLTRPHATDRQPTHQLVGCPRRTRLEFLDDVHALCLWALDQRGVR